MTDFCALLKKYREEAGLSLQELVDRIDKLGKMDNPNVTVTVSTLNRWENGSCIPQQNVRARKTLLYLAKSLGLPSEKTNCLLEAVDKNVIDETEQELFRSQHTELSVQVTENIKKFIQETLLRHFDNSYPSPILLFSPFDRAPIIDVIFFYAATRYPVNQRCHLTLPHINEDKESYFLELGERCGLNEQTHNGSEFEALLRKRISAHKPYFLLISRFEKISEEKCQELGGILRSLHECFPGQLHILLCGGQKLEELKLLTSAHSLLNYAKSYYWPELTREEVRLKHNHWDQNAPLSGEIIENLLRISGKHPALLESCLRWYQETPQQLADFTDRLSKDRQVFELFIPFIASVENKQRIAKWSNESKIASYIAYSSTALLRDLYWGGLLVKQEDGIYWRCEAIQLAGQFVTQ